jgi:D-glycero-alpha-D-manno-heptose-7-phosphate kinase
VNWSKVEFCNRIEDIEHPIVREALQLMGIDYPIEITTFSDIPGSTGLGSSSAFTVGLLHALYALKGQMVTKHTLACEAAAIEVDLLKRTMGKQDHFASSYGNLNVFTFQKDEQVIVEPVFYRSEVLLALEKNLLLFYTKLKRDASKILESQNRETPNKMDVLRKIKNLVNPLREVLSSGANLNQVGEILHEGWELKRSLTKDISSNEIDRYYLKARKAGAIGGKLLGAGGGGFLLFYVEPKNRQKVISTLNDLYHIPVGLDFGGTRITYYDQTKV